MAIQSTLFTSGMQEAVQYLQDVVAAAMKVQSGAKKSASSHHHSVESAPASNPALQAWQSMFAGPMSMLTGSADSTKH